MPVAHATELTTDSLLHWLGRQGRSYALANNEMTLIRSLDYMTDPTTVLRCADIFYAIDILARQCCGGSISPSAVAATIVGK
jgi:hypothetical protein